MFTDKTRPQLSTVSTVHGFYDAPGVKTVRTVDTVDSSARPPAPKPQIYGYIIRMETATGMWYQNGRSVNGSVLGWTQELRKAWIYPSRIVGDPAAEKETQEIRALVGDRAIVNVAVLPVRKTPIDRCEIIEE